MEYITVGQKFNQGKVAKVACIKNDNLKSIDIKDKRFLLIVLTSGQMVLSCKGQKIAAQAPCFICFDESENPVFIRKAKAEYYCVYFHPDFLNVNMTFDFIRSERYEDIAGNHDMFMLKPFTDSGFIVPIIHSFFENVIGFCEGLIEEFTHQRDWYWSCRGRSYFMELIIALERMYSMMEYGKVDDNDTIKQWFKIPQLHDAMLYIEGHYMNDITLDDICTAGNISHTTLTRIIKEKIGMSASQYLYYYRVQIAKKQLEFTDVPIKDIAARTGFKTVQHFNRTFTKLIGETPAGFRKTAVQKRKDEIK